MLPACQEWEVLPEGIGPQALRNSSKPGQSSTCNLLVQDMIGFEEQEFLEGGALSPFIRVPGLTSLGSCLGHSCIPLGPRSRSTGLLLVSPSKLSKTRMRNSSARQFCPSRDLARPYPSHLSCFVAHALQDSPLPPQHRLLVGGFQGIRTNSWFNGNFPHSPDSLTSDPDPHPSADSLIRALPPENRPPCGKLGPVKDKDRSPSHSGN
ncbi:hypothetical protein IWX47DRAFT_405529 [Phyllosticta citricarpa]